MYSITALCLNCVFLEEKKLGGKEGVNMLKVEREKGRSGFFFVYLQSVYFA